MATSRLCFEERPPSRRSGQSAVETLLLMPILLCIFMAMYYLFTITFASQNAHLRAREFALHGDTYLGDRAYQVSGGTVWDEGMGNYQKAEPGSPLSLSASSRDESIQGMSSDARQRLEATAYLGE